MTREQARAWIDALVRMRSGATDNQALDAPELYPAWRVGVSYAAGDRLHYNGALYRCLQAHTSQPIGHRTQPPASTSGWSLTVAAYRSGHSPLEPPMPTT